MSEEMSECVNHTPPPTHPPPPPHLRELVQVMYHQYCRSYEYRPLEHRGDGGGVEERAGPSVEISELMVKCFCGRTAG